MNVMALLLWPSKCRLHLLKGLLLPLLRSRFVYMLLIIITMRRVELSKAKRIKSETSCPVCDNYLDSFLQTFKLVHGSSNQLHSALYGPYSLMISTNHEIIIIPHFIMSHFFKSLKYLFQMHDENEIVRNYVIYWEFLRFSWSWTQLGTNAKMLDFYNLGDKDGVRALENWMCCCSLYGS